MEWNFIKLKKKRKKGKSYVLDLSGYEDHKIPDNYVPTKYLDAFNILFKFENVLRIFVYYVLKSNFGKQWTDFQIKNDSGSKIFAYFKQRRGKPKKYEYIGKISENPIMYLTLEELFLIMRRRKDLFNRYFKGSLEALKEKFDELSVTRNNLAHFREITKKDLDRIKMIFEDVSPYLMPFFMELFAEDENITDFNFKDNEEILKAWCFLIENCKHSRLFLLTNKKKTQIIIRAGIYTKNMEQKLSEELEYFNVVEYPFFIEYLNVDFMKLYKRVEEILPFITHFTYADEMRPLEERKGEHKGEYRSGEMSDFVIIFYSEFNQFLNNYKNFFISLKSVLGDIEEDFRKFEKYPKHIFNILKKHQCHISEDFKEYEAPFELPTELYIEDWNKVSFGHENFLDFWCLPWITERMGCFGTE